MKKRASNRHGRSAEAGYRETLHKDHLPGQDKKSIKDLLQEMPPGGEDADFERAPDRGRDVEL